MAYEKQNFTPGQKLKAEHLNHIEEGIEDLEQRMTSEGGYELLWTNFDSELGQERIDIPNLMDYDRIEIVHVTATESVATSSFNLKWLRGHLGYLFVFYGGYLYERRFAAGNEGIEFYGGYSYDLRDEGRSTDDVEACAPVEIYGIKEGGL